MALFQNENQFFVKKQLTVSAFLGLRWVDILRVVPSLKSFLRLNILRKQFVWAIIGIVFHDVPGYLERYCCKFWGLFIIVPYFFFLDDDDDDGDVDDDFFLRFFSVSILKKQIPTQRYFERPIAVNFGNNSHIRCLCDDIERRVTPACVEFWIGWYLDDEKP